MRYKSSDQYREDYNNLVKKAKENDINPNSQPMRNFDKAIKELRSAESRVNDLEQKLDQARRDGDTQAISRLSKDIEAARRALSKAGDNARSKHLTAEVWLDGRIELRRSPPWKDEPPK